MSDCGRYAISIITFIGSVFSPWYRWSGRRDPANNCCINVALYGPGARWTMTDRGRNALRRSADKIEIGPSHARWEDGQLILSINEMSWPHLQTIEGEIIIHPTALTDVEIPLKEDGSHIWRPFAPTSRIEVKLNRKGWSWNGHGYFDANFGTAALEDDFDYWTWARMPHRGGTACFYDVLDREGRVTEAAIRFEADGTPSFFTPPPKQNMRRSLWLLKKEGRGDVGFRPRQNKHMLDAPFYCRAGIETKIDGDIVQGVHEALDLRRFASPLLKPMLAVKVPRRAGWRFPD
ncbi:MAG: carotenoid 1,2-hydratase [Pseudomonadota bacterium]